MAAVGAEAAEAEYSQDRKILNRQVVSYLAVYEAKVER
jgi:hypothetical protein